MRILIVEDELVSRMLLQKFLSVLGECTIAVNGMEAVEAFTLAWREKKPFDLICLDVMMPGMDGQEALKLIRDSERKMGIKGLTEEVRILMTTALSDEKNVMDAYYWGATEYLFKPITKKALFDKLHALGIMGS